MHPLPLGAIIKSTRYATPRDLTHRGMEKTSHLGGEWLRANEARCVERTVINESSFVMEESYQDVWIYLFIYCLVWEGGKSRIGK